MSAQDQPVESLICVECCQRFSTLEAGLKHIFPVSTVSYNDASPGRPKKIKTVEVSIQLRKHQLFPVSRP